MYPVKRDLRGDHGNVFGFRRNEQAPNLQRGIHGHHHMLVGLWIETFFFFRFRLFLTRQAFFQKRPLLVADSQVFPQFLKLSLEVVRALVIGLFIDDFTPFLFHFRAKNPRKRGPILARR